MAWTTPMTWAQALVTEDDLNEQIRDNLLFLFDPTEDHNTGDKGSNYTTTSTSFAAVDTAGGDDLRLVITPQGEDLEIEFDCSIAHSAANSRVYFNFYIDGVAVVDGDGLQVMTASSGVGVGAQPVHVRWIARGLSLTSHTIDVYWKTSAGTATMYNGAGTANFDLHPVFTVGKAY
jgi:hypothetical protein